MTTGRVALIAACGLAAALAGCASNIRRMEDVQAIGGTAFTQALTEEYRSFVAHEKDERDWTAADYFAIKGLAAAGGQVVLPEEAPEAGDNTQALVEGRNRLMAALAVGGRESNPALAARAQRAFDCWQHEAAEDSYDNIIEAHVASCREEFEAAIAPLPMAYDDSGMMPHIVLFDFDRSDLNPAGMTVIGQVLADAPKRGSVNISATGHADRAGADDYNMALSLRRADAVRSALIAGGFSPSAITVAGRGESEPAVSTPDGIKEQANRRVEIVLQ